MVDTSSAPFPLLLTAFSSFSLPMLTLTRCPQLWHSVRLIPQILVALHTSVSRTGRGARTLAKLVRRIDICWLLEKITSGEDCMAVDRVQSEPLSGPFPLTGNNTEKFYGFLAMVAIAKSSIPLDMRGLWQRCPIWGSLEQGIIGRLSGNDHSLIGCKANVPSD
jgi:hypothetical protein